MEQRNTAKWANLYLVRHGESTCNEVNRFAGMLDVPLTALGRAQARRASTRWRDALPDRVYASPLQRARHTAEILFPSAAAGTAAGCGIVVDERLNERHFGAFTMGNKAFIQRKIGLENYEKALYGDVAAMSDGESFDDFRCRVLTFLREEIHPLLLQGKRVLVVAHKYVIELLSRFILRLPDDEGYDLRLPNANVLRGSELGSYLRSESRGRNNVQEWISLNYSVVLLAGVFVGLLLRRFHVLPRTPSAVNLVLLSVATAISLARVDIVSRLRISLSMLCVRGMLIRYCGIPLVLGIIGRYYPAATWVFPVAVSLAAPAAITGITISRSMGGLVFPVAFAVLASSALSTLVLMPLLAAYGMTNLLEVASRLLIISGASLLVPLLVVLCFRRRFPIETARFAERKSACSIVVMVLFVVLSFQNVDLGAFRTYGLWAVGLGVLQRVTAFLLRRRDSIFAVDDYVGMSYPNIFFVIVLASMLGRNDVAGIATWYLLPMFALAPLDEWICRKIEVGKYDIRLLLFLGIRIRGDATESGRFCAVAPAHDGVRAGLKSYLPAPGRAEQPGIGAARRIAPFNGA